MATRIHPTALIEDDVQIGDGTSIWDNVHIRHGATIGRDCIVGEKSYVAYDVNIGNLVKINAMVYICAAVTIEDGVMISAGTVFTNDRFPRATTVDLRELRPSEPDEETLPTLVKAGATIGAGCVIGNDLAIGRFAMVGMGSAGHQGRGGLPSGDRPPGQAGGLCVSVWTPHRALRRLAGRGRRGQLPGVPTPVPSDRPKRRGAGSAIVREPAPCLNHPDCGNMGGSRSRRSNEKNDRR